jgi:uncharacterized protein
MFFMASTDLAHFRRFIFESSFLDTYVLDQKTIDKIREDDVELMLFSFDYLANTLFGAEIAEMSIKEDKLREKVAQIKQRQDEAVISAVKDYEDMKKERESK